MNINPKNIVKNSLVFYLILGVIAAFIVGYFAGIESEHEKNKIAQDLKNIEQKNSDLEKQESKIFKITKDDDPILGDPNAPISIIEFSDYQCPFCARFYLNTLPLLEADYIQKGTVNFIYRDFPIQNHLNAMPAAIACSYCLQLLHQNVLMIRANSGNTTIYYFKDKVCGKDLKWN